MIRSLTHNSQDKNNHQRTLCQNTLSCDTVVCTLTKHKSISYPLQAVVWPILENASYFQAIIGARSSEFLWGKCMRATHDVLQADWPAGHPNTPRRQLMKCNPELKHTPAKSKQNTTSLISRSHERLSGEYALSWAGWCVRVEHCQYVRWKHRTPFVFDGILLTYPCTQSRCNCWEEHLRGLDSKEQSGLHAEDRLCTLAWSSNQ